MATPLLKALSIGPTPPDGAAELLPPEVPIAGEFFPTVDVNVMRLRVPLADIFEAEDGAMESLIGLESLYRGWSNGIFDRSEIFGVEAGIMESLIGLESLKRRSGRWNL